MKTHPRAETVVVLSVSPIEADYAFLEDVLNNSHWTLCPDSKWTLYRSGTLASSLTILARKRLFIVVSECDSLSGTWKEILEQLKLLPDPPFLILTSRLADEYLWAEALNIGAYDTTKWRSRLTGKRSPESSAWLGCVGRINKSIQTNAATVTTGWTLRTQN